MSSLTIHDIDDELTEEISRRAARHGRSAEEEARYLLRQALNAAGSELSSNTTKIEPHFPRPGNLASRIRARVEPIGGVELELPPRGPGREPPSFD